MLETFATDFDDVGQGLGPGPGQGPGLVVDVASKNTPPPTAAAAINTQPTDENRVVAGVANLAVDDHVAVTQPVPVTQPAPALAAAPAPVPVAAPVSVAASLGPPIPDPPAGLAFLLTTSLSQPVKKGDHRLQVAAQAGCVPGMDVKIGPSLEDKGYEIHKIAALGSLVLESPLVNSYPAGTTVVVSAPAGGGAKDSGKDKDKDNASSSRENPNLGNTVTSTATITKPVKVKYTVGQKIQANYRESGKQSINQSIKQSIIILL